MAESNENVPRSLKKTTGWNEFYRQVAVSILYSFKFRYSILIYIYYPLVHDVQYTGHCVFIYYKTLKCCNYAICVFPTCGGMTLIWKYLC